LPAASRRLEQDDDALPAFFHQACSLQQFDLQVNIYFFHNFSVSSGFYRDNLLRANPPIIHRPDRFLFEITGFICSSKAWRSLTASVRRSAGQNGFQGPGQGLGVARFDSGNNILNRRSLDDARLRWIRDDEDSCRHRSNRERYRVAGPATVSLPGRNVLRLNGG